MRNSHLLTTTFAVAALAFAGACGKKDATTTDTTTAASATPTPSALSVMDIDMGRHIGPDKKITDKTDDFAPTDTLYASVHLSGSAPNGSVVGRWTFENGTVVDERTESV